MFPDVARKTEALGAPLADGVNCRSTMPSRMFQAKFFAKPCGHEQSFAALVELHFGLAILFDMEIRYEFRSLAGNDLNPAAITADGNQPAVAGYRDKTCPFARHVELSLETAIRREAR